MRVMVQITTHASAEALLNSIELRLSQLWRILLSLLLLHLFSTLPQSPVFGHFLMHSNDLVVCWLFPGGSGATSCCDKLRKCRLVWSRGLFRIAMGMYVNEVLLIYHIILFVIHSVDIRLFWTPLALNRTIILPNLITYLIFLSLCKAQSILGKQMTLLRHLSHPKNCPITRNRTSIMLLAATAHLKAISTVPDCHLVNHVELLIQLLSMPFFLLYSSIFK